MAKCSYCGKPAVYYDKPSRRYLCREHFIEFVEGKVERAIERHKLFPRNSRVLAAVSGGKDSSTLAGVLSRLSSKYGLEVILLHIDLGIGEYSVKSREAVESLARAVGLPLIVFSVKDVIGMSIPELALRSKRPTCSVCGTVKRYVMNAAAIELNADAVATGHNANDIATYAVKSFLTMRLEDLAKQVPSTPRVDGLAAPRVRPLYYVSEKESFLYSTLRGLPFYHEECPHARLTSLDFRIKESLVRLEEQFPGLRNQFLVGLARNARAFKVEEGQAVPCKHCGLISWRGECTFCRLTARVLGSAMGMKVRKWFRAMHPTGIYKG